MKRIIVLTILFLIILIGIIIPKLLIKNPGFGPSACLNQAVTYTPKFPASLFKTAEIEELSRTHVKIKFYTIFAIKLPQETQLFCTLAN